ncbi:hypothetical protein [Comamonas antarctica]|uniref:Uncharacterized protein n=1 Tax=Comamonas antarctica TaxID=2743470 RepID=A0A6N1X282_9BURK|nr:hypothetical protein [Comamonas antarctica]QKV52453.1 hypothetical protein HUK68_05775 [Comamonas antarctica]
MKKPSKNPSNPYADAVDKIDAQHLHFLLNQLQEHINENDGEFTSLLSMTIRHGLLDVYNYIQHERQISPASDNLQDYFNIVPPASTARDTDGSNQFSMQQVVSVSFDQGSFSVLSAYSDSFNDTIYSDWAPHASDAAGPDANTTPPPAPSPTVTLSFNTGPHASVVINVASPSHAQQPGVHAHVNPGAQDIYLGERYLWDGHRYLNADAMDQVVAVDAEDHWGDDAWEAASSSFQLWTELSSGYYL